MSEKIKMDRNSPVLIGKWIKPGTTLLMGILAASGGTLRAENVPTASVSMSPPAETSPWAFDLTLYTWLPGLDGKFSAGPLSKSVDETFIDIVDHSRTFPLGFMGRFEAKYDRFGIYLDGNWFDLDFKPKSGPRGFASVGLRTEMGILDYGLMYRVSGPPDLANWKGISTSNRLDLYVGGRTIWIDNTVQPERLPSRSASKSLTSPVVGGRIYVDFGRDWFMKIDGNVGGFGVDNVSFAGGILGSMGYRTTVLDLPMAFELGYKALKVEVGNKSVETSAVMNGPFIGATALW